jgi:hypothetical protein
MNAYSRFKRAAGVVVLLTSVSASAACGPSGRLYVRVGPPAPIFEARVVAPGPGYIWVGGYHTWDRGAYIWVPGRWVLPPRPRAIWVPGRWERDRHGWFWMDGHWR